MIKVDRLVKSFNHEKVLDGVSFEIRKGEVAVIMGSSGTGKSVLLLHLIGLMSPDAGTIEIDGTEITALDEHRLLGFRRNIGYLFQEGALYDFMTVFENVAFPLREHAGMKAGAVRDKVEAYLKLVDMDGTGDKYPAELSGGMKKRVALARALIMDTKVLLCDEPTSGLDPVRSRDISLLIRGLSKKMNTTTVVTSHDIANSFRLADRSFILNEGRIAAEGKEEDLRRSGDPFVKEFLG